MTWMSRVLIGLVVLVPWSMALGTPYYVDSDVGSSGDCTSWATACKTIQEAVTKLDADDEDGVIIIKGDLGTPRVYSEGAGLSIGTGFNGYSVTLQAGGVDQSVEISGSTNALVITATGASTGVSSQTLQYTCTAGNCVYINADLVDTTFEGCSISATGANATNRGVYIVGSAGNSGRDTTFINTSVSASGGTNNYGLYSGKTNGTISASSGSSISGTNGGVWLAADASAVDVAGSTITGTQYGLVLSGAYTYPTINVTGGGSVISTSANSTYSAINANATVGTITVNGGTVQSVTGANGLNVAGGTVTSLVASNSATFGGYAAIGVASGATVTGMTLDAATITAGTSGGIVNQGTITTLTGSSLTFGGSGVAIPSSGAITHLSLDSCAFGGGSGLLGYISTTYSTGTDWRVTNSTSTCNGYAVSIGKNIAHVWLENNKFTPTAGTSTVVLLGIENNGIARNAAPLGQVVVRNNLIKQSADDQHGLFLADGCCQYRGQVVRNIVAGGNATVPIKGENILFADNLVYAPGITGGNGFGSLVCYGMQHCDIINNTVVNGYDWALLLTTDTCSTPRMSQYNVIRGNIFANNTDEKACVYVSRKDTAAAKNIIDNNLYYNPHASGVVMTIVDSSDNAHDATAVGDTSTAGTMRYYWYTDYPSSVEAYNDANSVIGNPLFVSETYSASALPSAAANLNFLKIAAASPGAKAAANGGPVGAVPAVEQNTNLYIIPQNRGGF